MTPAVVQAFDSNRDAICRLEQLPLFEKRPARAVIPAVVQTLWYRKGKRLRSHWVFWFGTLSGLPKEKLDLYAWIVEAIHTASLLHDDVVDEARERRGGPSANHLHGNGAAVLSGDYFLSDALARLAAQGEPSLLAELCTALRSLSAGELLQRELRGKIPLNEDSFVEVSHQKTSALFEWAAIVGPTLAGRQDIEAMRWFARSFGELFQFSDDLLDLRGGDGKDAWADLSEGRLNRASWWLAQSDSRFRDCLERVFRAGGPLEMAVREGKRSYSRPESSLLLREKLGECQARALRRLQALPPVPLRDALAGLLSLVVERVC